MPNSDLATITSVELIDNVKCAYAINRRVPWCLKTDSRLFLDCVLPIRIVCESSSNYRRTLSQLVFPKINKCQNVRDAVVAAMSTLNNIVRDDHLYGSFPYEYPVMGGLEYAQGTVGYSCRGRSLRAVAILRSIGIPARVVEDCTSQPIGPMHAGLQYFDIQKYQWICWDSEDQVNGDISYTNRMFKNDECFSFMYPAHAGVDLMGKQAYNYMTNIVETVTYPSGWLKVFVEDGNKPVNNAKVVVYYFNFADGYIIGKTNTNPNGDACIKLGCRRKSRPYIVSVTKGGQTAFSLYYPMPNKIDELSVNLTNQPNEYVISTQTVSKLQW